VLIELTGTLLVAIAVYAAGDSALPSALGYGCLVMAILVLSAGAFSLLAGGMVLEDKFPLAWAGVPLQRRGPQHGTVGGLTLFGIALITTPLLFVGAGVLI
jgi:hypothetical protein